jgi:cytidylate kinase
MTKDIVVISREFGSGGRTIGKKLAEKLGYKCYDAEIIAKIAEETGFSENYVAGQSDRRPNFSKAPLFDTNYMVKTNQDIIRESQRKVILELADKGKCVIVGRCADYILKDHPSTLKVFIHAPLDKRMERIINVYGETDEDPEKRIKNKDRRRKAYHSYYTGNEWGDVNNYDICLDSYSIGIGECVEILRQLCK